ncbi:MAG: hypothetical protein QNL12_11755 [Acidimicrobiia bacterium]|nr:hypothetical protein [Acidimicrobiia bacterium]MDX2467982.1 hypothetical protein [Acidimicrobiia bacterium]
MDLLDGSESQDSAISVSADAPLSWLEATRSGEIELAGDGAQTVLFSISVAGTHPQDLGSGVAILAAHANSDVIYVSRPGGTNQEDEVRLIRHLHGCEQTERCEISFIANGNAGDVISWTLEYHYGFFDLATPPTGAAISISDPEVTISLSN